MQNRFIWCRLNYNVCGIVLRVHRRNRLDASQTLIPCDLLYSYFFSRIRARVFCLSVCRFDFKEAISQASFVSVRLFSLFHQQFAVLSRLCDVIQIHCWMRRISLSSLISAVFILDAPIFRSVQHKLCLLLFLRFFTYHKKNVSGIRNVKMRWRTALWHLENWSLNANIKLKSERSFRNLS